MNNKSEISIIIPCQNDLNDLSNCIKALKAQTIKPKDIIIVDSSDNNEIQNFVNNEHKLNVIKFTYKRIVKSYAGRSTNFGFNFVKYDFVGLLDTKTIPKQNWIESAINIFKSKNIDVVFGSTKFIAKNFFQKFVQSITYGEISHETVPGTVFKTNILKNDFILFNENVRAGYDIEWKQNIKKYLKFDNPNTFLIEYFSLPLTIFDLYKRYIVYSFHSARIEIQNSLKSLYLSVFLILISYLIPRWNLFISGWESNPFYIPYVSRIYLLSLAIIFLLYSLFYYFYNKKILILSNILSSTFKIIFITSLIYGLYKTLSLTENFNITTIDFITQILLISFILVSLVIRGIIFPLSRNIKKRYLFPFNFIPIALLGLSLDILKSPFYIFGAVIGLFNLYSKKENNFYNNKSFNIVFYTKYSSNSASIRYRFNAFEKILNENHYNIIKKPLFDDNFFKDKFFKNKINFFILIYSYYKRIIDLLTRKKPYIAIIHIELLPFMSFFGELLLKIRGIPFVLDVDDAVYHRFDQNTNILKKLINFKFSVIVKLSSIFFGGNHYHIKYFEKYSKRSVYLPTVINAQYYYDLRKKNKYNAITLVWIGTPSTSMYLNNIRNVLILLKTRFNLEINIIGIGNNNIKGLEYNKIEWSEVNEIELLSRSHIGIMPLNNDSWSLGKCGFKILQYMGAGIPVVASPVGVNKTIIKDGINGYLADNDEDWIKKLTNLIIDKNLRDEFSKLGYQTVYNNFNIINEEKKYIKEINFLKYNLLKKYNIEIPNEKKIV